MPVFVAYEGHPSAAKTQDPSMNHIGMFGLGTMEQTAPDNGIAVQEADIKISTPHTDANMGAPETVQPNPLPGGRAGVQFKAANQDAAQVTGAAETMLPGMGEEPAKESKAFPLVIIAVGLGLWALANILDQPKKRRT